jgi:tripartite-type tricarboxylate transporter receptor subunit TctC
MKFVPGIIAALLALFVAGVASAQTFPSKPMRIVVPFPPGGGIDLLGRMLAQKMAESVGQPVLVDNRAGGNTVIGAENVARSAPDGHSLLLALDSTMTMIPFTYSKVSYDSVNDFAPVSKLSATYIVVVGNPAKLPGKSLREAIEFARANPGKLNFGSAGLTVQLIGEQLAATQGVNITTVPYKGTAAVLPALLAGDIDFAIDGATTYMPHIRSGKLLPLAMAAPKRMDQLPDLPTLRELGYSQAEMDGWLGLFAPGATPRPVVQRLNSEVVKAWADPQVKQKLMANGFEPVPSTPEELAALVKSGMAQWGPVIKKLGIKFD